MHPCPSEVATLAIFARWSRFSSERDFYRYAKPSCAMPSPPCPTALSSTGSCATLGLIEEIGLHLAEMMKPQRCPYQALDSSAMPVRDAKRRGEGWLAGRADIGWSNSLGWYEGFRLLVAVDPTGVVTGFGFCGASVADQQAGRDILRRAPSTEPSVWRAWDRLSPRDSTWPTRASRAKKTIRRWLECYGARIIHPPKRNSPRSWPKGLRRWVAGIRQIVETVYDKLFNTFGLWRERPHELEGLRARLAARVALHNFCMWLNDQLGRSRLAFADLLGW